MTRLPAALLAGAIAAPAQADFFSNGTGLASPGQIVDFESVVLATNQVVTTEFQSLGVTFTGAFANPDPLVPYPNVSGNRISNFQSNIGHSALFVADFGSNFSEAATRSEPGTEGDRPPYLSPHPPSANPSALRAHVGLRANALGRSSQRLLRREATPTKPIPTNSSALDSGSGTELTV